MERLHAHVRGCTLKKQFVEQVDGASICIFQNEIVVPYRRVIIAMFW